MTTFTPLRGGRHRCNHEGCKKLVKKSQLDRHRSEHWNRDRPAQQRIRDEPTHDARQPERRPALGFYFGRYL